MKPILFILLLLSMGGYPSVQAHADMRSMSSDECSALGGEILSSLGGKDCGKDELLGRVTGMRCPCLCCRRTESVPKLTELSGDQCKELGGSVQMDPGGGVTCDSGEETLGFISLGIEGGICCRNK